MGTIIDGLDLDEIRHGPQYWGEFVSEGPFVCDWCPEPAPYRLERRHGPLPHPIEGTGPDGPTCGSTKTGLPWPPKRDEGGNVVRWKGGASLDENAHEHERLSVSLVKNPKPKQWEPLRLASYSCPYDTKAAARILRAEGYALDAKGWEHFPDEGDGPCWQIDLTKEE